MKKILMLVMAAMLLFSAAGCKKEEVVTPSEPGTSSEVSEPVSTFDTSKEIKVISREEGSGTRGAFIELFGIEEKDADGNYISYVNYANDYLKFANCMNNGKAGRMFSDYAGEELAFSLSMGNMFNNSADIAVIFLGVNDYLTNRENKRYGDYYAIYGTSAY